MIQYQGKTTLFVDKNVKKKKKSSHPRAEGWNIFIMDKKLTFGTEGKVI